MNSLKKNLFYQVVYQCITVVLPFITSPYIARVLGADNTGIYSYTYTIANYFVVFGMLGLEQYGNRCIAQVRDNKAKMSEIFTELYVLHVIIAIPVFLIYVIYSFVSPMQYKVYFFIQGLYVISMLFDVNWFFFGLEKFDVTVIRNSVIKLLAVLSIFLFVREKSDLWIYVLIMALSTFISQAVLFTMVFKYVKVQRIKFSFLRKHLKPMLLLFIAVIATNLNRMIDKVMLGWFDKMTELGCYDYADHIIRIPLSFIAAFGTIMISRMSNLCIKKDEGEVRTETELILDNSACIILIFSFALGFGVAAIAPEFVPLYLGAEYKETEFLVIILAMSIPLVGWNNYVRTQMLIPRKMDVIYTKAVVIGALTNITLNVVLVQLYGAQGAAVATVLSYLIISILQTKGLLKSLDVKRYLHYIPYPFFSGCIMYICVRIVASIFEYTWISLLIEVIAGVVIYVSMIALYLKIKKPQVIKLLYRRARNYENESENKLCDTNERRKD